jgi:hypothetical protein
MAMTIERELNVSENMKTCSFCGEEILSVAKKCKHCGSALAEQDAVAPAADYGLALLAIPAAATMLVWFWVSGMNLMQSPGSTLTLIGVVTVLATAVIAAMEAAKAGMTRDKSKGTHTPVTWFFLIVLLWIVGYPAYLLKRKHYGLKNRLVPGLLLALVFLASWSMMNSAIETRKAEIRGNLEQMQRQFESMGQ